MSGTAAAGALRRFWTRVEIAAGEGGHAVLLDGKPVRTPSRAPLALPARALAEAVAAEWQAQGARIEPQTMPLTRLANSAIDSVVPAPDAVASALAAYARSDLLCHRAGAPAALAAREADAWDPLLAWAAEAHGAPLRAGAGVLPLAQPAESLARLADAVAACPPFALAALHVLVTISGSLVLGLAVARRRLAAEDAFRLSRIDEDWQIAHWGEDAEAALVARRRREEFMTADLFLTLLET